MKPRGESLAVRPRVMNGHADDLTEDHRRAIDGKYDIIIDAAVARQKAALELVTKGTKLSGSLTGAMEITFSDGVVNGNDLNWTMQGQIATFYPTVYTWICRATVDDDTITGTMNLGVVIGEAPFHGVRAGTGHVDVAPTLPWKDLGLPRYEPVSADWVNALNAYVKEKVKGKKLDFDLIWSVEYTDPPAHLLRGHGPDIIGYHYVFKHGAVDVCDGPRADADIHFKYPYSPLALNLRMNTNDYIAWAKDEGAHYLSQVKTTGDLDKMAPLNGVLAGPGNDIREEFFSQQTA